MKIAIIIAIALATALALGGGLAGALELLHALQRINTR